MGLLLWHHPSQRQFNQDRSTQSSVARSTPLRQHMGKAHGVDDPMAVKVHGAGRTDENVPHCGSYFNPNLDAMLFDFGKQRATWSTRPLLDSIRCRFLVLHS